MAMELALLPLTLNSTCVTSDRNYSCCKLSKRFSGVRGRRLSSQWDSRCPQNGRKLYRMAVASSEEVPETARNRFKNMNTPETDDMFDDLFKKYGKVIYRSNDRNSPTSEVDDDSESLSFAVALAKVANDVKAGDIRVLFVKPLVYWTRFFIIVTAFSRPQIDAIGTRIRDLAEKQYDKVPTGDTKPNSWTLLDFGDVVVHIFLPQQRAFYNLEEFYANATPIELPFDS